MVKDMVLYATVFEKLCPTRKQKAGVSMQFEERLKSKSSVFVCDGLVRAVGQTVKITEAVFPNFCWRSVDAA